MSQNPLISIISPVYRAEKIVPELVKRIVDEISNITSDFEILLVEDGSPDNSWKSIESECNKDVRVKGIKLSRNFGQNYAVTAGLENCKGEYIVIMDCDLQDNPADIRKLYTEAINGFDIIYTKRLGRKHSTIKKIGSLLYQKILNYATDGKYTIDTGSLVLFNRQVLGSILSLNEQERLYVQMLKWVGYNSTVVEVVHNERFEGRSTYTFRSIITLAFSGMIAHSNKLLMMSVAIGCMLSILSLLAIVSIIILYFRFHFQSGWVSIICAILFSTGLILMSVGVLGLYIGKIYVQVKHRPLYIIHKKLN